MSNQLTLYLNHKASPEGPFYTEPVLAVFSPKDPTTDKRRGKPRKIKTKVPTNYMILSNGHWHRVFYDILNCRNHKGEFVKEFYINLRGPGRSPSLGRVEVNHDGSFTGFDGIEY